MFDAVPTLPKRIDDYRPIIGDAAADELRRLAEPLRGARVLHVNATAFGGGVAELLSAEVPLLNDLGLRSEWQVIKGADEFFTVTKKLHNALQGAAVALTPAMRETWRRYNRANANLFAGGYDFVVVHDPQPAGLLPFLRERDGNDGSKWIWRCHIDLTSAQDEAWAFLRPYLQCYHAAIFTSQQYVKGDLRVARTAIIPPAIDPLSPKNAEIGSHCIVDVLSRYGVDPTRPIIAQVSRFDPWKDPLGVIDAYHIVKRTVPSLQLLMVGSMASDDPEGWSYFERAAQQRNGDRDVFLLSNLNGVGNIEVNAFQRAAAVVIQKSTREGFGLTVSEALWKGRPVVGGNAGGIPLQVVHGQTGFLVDDVEGCASRVLHLLHDRDLAAALGAAGRERVRERFLVTRVVADYLRLFQVLQTTAAVSLAALA